MIILSLFVVVMPLVITCMDGSQRNSNTGTRTKQQNRHLCTICLFSFFQGLNELKSNYRKYSRLAYISSEMSALISSCEVPADCIQWF